MTVFNILGLSRPSHYWIFEQKIRIYNKIIYSEVLWIYFVHKQPMLSKILSFF
jgi:hypothetical protein